ncbi:reverse transcriptase domain-containing protein [Tanacetum coccineum]
MKLLCGPVDTVSNEGWRLYTDGASNNEGMEIIYRWRQSLLNNTDGASNARGDLTPGPKAWRLYTDGASNNEGSEAGLILIAPDDVEYSYALRLNFSNSNNEAEYEALLAGLRIAKRLQ